ncbi:hypothetical protein HOE37_02340 [Candidatus Woesearchaeota archaeon]|nr:hypothetical protein [Candidatus Woesearchaeota archaeon]MBT4110672.1 hypothetical protein [Candidatus Woesearchaeota archaeon]MBT4336268.1 hypothetical protein [Candidatus Woesearchaeota archaeon]MBT4469371.1 hypothetical protein [Candidatus Woesearchaeota archaeon]MBT6743806.1 hypothetical protein [Candidatus Woesearchaeota archaeon]
MFITPPNLLVVLATYLGLTLGSPIDIGFTIPTPRSKIQEIGHYTEGIIGRIEKRIEKFEEFSVKEKMKEEKEALSELEEKVDQVFVLSGVEKETPSHKPKNAIFGKEEIFLYPVVMVKNGKEVEYYSSAPEIKIKGKNIRTNPNKETRAKLEHVIMQWSKVEPLIDSHFPYENSDPDTRKWLGIDKINYASSQVEKTKGLQRILADAKPTKQNHNFELGTMRFSLELRINDKSWNTPNHNNVKRGGIKSDVLRICYLLDETFLGWTTSYFNVPGIYGSASLNHSHSQRSHQTELYLGFDCADLIVGAARHLNRKYKYTNADGLRQQTEYSDEYLLHQNGEITDLEGNTAQLKYDQDVQQGDLVFFADQNSNRYWHVVVLLEDVNDLSATQRKEKEDAERIFNGHDPILHYDNLGLGLSKLTSVSYQTQKIVFGRIKH